MALRRQARWVSFITVWVFACDARPEAGPTPTPTPEAANPGADLAEAAGADAPVPTEATTPTTPDDARSPSARGFELAHALIVLDGHVDVPYRLRDGLDAAGRPTEDVGEATTEGDFDHPRALKGGLDAPFMSIYIPARYEAKGAKKLADELIDMVEGFPKAHPDRFALARSVADVKANFEAKRVSLPMGMENGAPLEGNLGNVEYFHGRGIRYITLTHSKDNHISDSSFDDAHTHGGLSAFGKQVVAEMNRVGIMIDVSHISDDAFSQVMELTKAPVIASHSSCRHFTPGWERNMADDMIRQLAGNGGVIQINFGSSFLDDEVRKTRSRLRDEGKAELAKRGVAGEDDEHAFWDEWWADHPAPVSTVERVADHIDHVKKLVGIDHVGLGSDFDGVGDSLPTGLKDVSDYPNLFAELVRRGYTDAEIEKIASGNVLRVWSAVEAHAAGQTQAQG
jgi:membrane dipeptidase